MLCTIKTVTKSIATVGKSVKFNSHSQNINHEKHKVSCIINNLACVCLAFVIALRFVAITKSINFLTHDYQVIINGIADH